MRSNPVTVGVLEPRKNAVQKISKYNLLAVPVVEQDGRISYFGEDRFYFPYRDGHAVVGASNVKADILPGPRTFGPGRSTWSRTLV